MEERFEETDSRIDSLEKKLAEREQEIIVLQRERSELKGTLAQTEGELGATKVEAEQDINNLKDKVGEKRLFCLRTGIFSRKGEFFKFLSL